MSGRRSIRFGLVLALAFLTGCGDRNESATAQAAEPAIASGPVSVQETRHFTLSSSADPALTAEAGRAAEALLEAYVTFLDVPAETSEESTKFQLRIYASRAELKANSRSRPWAEAYYVSGTCHAYIDPAKTNPYQWLLHEVVHQLNRELTGFAKDKWINEGLATYLGSSRYAGGELVPGMLDFNAYPLWWLKRWELSGDWTADVQAQRVVPLRALITGQGGPPLDATVNAHYLGYWSLTHFLLHHEEGKYAAGYHQLIRNGGSLDDFERHIGPPAVIESEWYAYLQAKVTEAH